MKVTLHLEQLEDRTVPSLITVNSLTDDPGGPTPGIVTLRDAINQNNTDHGNDVIQFASGLGGGTLTLRNELPHVNYFITIDGPFGPPITIQRDSTAGNFRCFYFGPGVNAGVDNLIIDNFNAGTEDGGGILCDAVQGLTLNYVTISNCKAGAHGGGLEMYGASYALAVNNCVFSTDTAPFAGGAFALFGGATSRSDWSSTSFKYCQANAGGGGYFEDSGRDTFGLCTFQSNTADVGGGGYNNGINNSVEFDGCFFFLNATRISGGGFESVRGVTIFAYADPLTPTEFSMNQTREGGGLYISANAVVTFDGCYIHGNTAVTAGTGYFYEPGSVIHIIDLNNPDGTN